MYYDKFDLLCKSINIKPGTVARMTGISTATITAWKQDKYTPKQGKLQKIADYFQVPLEYFIQDKEKEPINIDSSLTLINSLSLDRQQIVSEIIGTLQNPRPAPAEILIIVGKLIALSQNP